ncbi:MAG: monovalent cation/H(+) antiporter subunit G [Synechococcales cyanobacterium RU_4_20]|nr:monovalent cation/H(+) antiporter subunit G [Synechococcales cyanobacterium RU_4_20]NJR70136.1 monovalent cation/H(+) antiporter subunit G [Synechococcales cyanobacterium CRU_2_2]
MIKLLSYSCIGLGLVFWLWGTSSLLSRRSVLFKLHNLSVSDTLGSIAIILGLLLQRSREWPLLLLAILTLTLWNTMLGYVLAYCSSNSSIKSSLTERRISSHDR